MKLEIYRSFERHVPENAIHYCFDLWVTHQFEFKIARKRNTKLGDFRYNPQLERQRITINHNLNRYAFLITYIHEVAHLINLQSNGRRIAPHGSEWKEAFKALMKPLLNDLVFPPDLLARLQRHMKNPKASSGADPQLHNALKKYDESNGLTALSEIDPTVTFRLGRRIFRKQEVKRTRALCEEIKTGRKYLIPLVAEVVPLG